MNTPHQRSDKNDDTMAYEIDIQYFVPTNGQTINLANSSGVNIHVMLGHTGTIASLTIVMPTQPFNGQRISMESESQVTAFTLQPGVAGATFNITATQILAKAFIEWVYVGEVKLNGNPTVVNKWVRYG